MADIYEKIKMEFRENYYDKDKSNINDFWEEILGAKISENGSFKLYRYCTANYRNIRDLEKGQIRINNNGNMNDVYEGLPQNIGFGTSREQIECLGKMFYLTSFSERNDSPVMWGHYGDNNRGICIEYEFFKSENDLENMNLFPVVYTEKRTKSYDIKRVLEVLEYLDDANNTNDPGIKYLHALKRVFITKGREWEYEKEWRIIYDKADKIDIEYESRIIPVDFITGIYMGYRINPEIEEHLKEIAARNKIKLCKAELQEDEYKIGFRQINIENHEE